MKTTKKATTKVSSKKEKKATTEKLLAIKLGGLWFSRDAARKAKKATAKPAKKAAAKPAAKPAKKAAAKPAAKPAKKAEATPAAKPKKAEITASEQPTAKAEEPAKVEAVAPEAKPFDPFDYPEYDDEPEWQQGEDEPFSDNELALFRENLRVLRAKLSGKAASLQSQSLHRYDEVNNAEDGTDAMLRNTELKKASLDEDQIKQIDMALLALEKGSYGVCHNCGRKIGAKRLLAIPFAKFCIQCQSEMEEQEARRGPATDSDASGYDD